MLAEFVVSFIPLMTTFFTFVQVAKLSTSRIAVRHAAIVAARAAAVMSNEGNNVPLDAAGQAEIEDAAKLAVAPWIADGSFTTVRAQVSDSSNRSAPDGPYGFVSVAVTAQTRCTVPLGRLLCPGGSRTMTETVAMPHQGARYIYEP